MKKCFIITLIFTLLLAIVGCNTANDGVSSKKPTNVNITGIITTPLNTEVTKVITTPLEIPNGFEEIKGKGTRIISSSVLSLSSQADIDNVINDCIVYYQLPEEYTKIEYSPTDYGLDFGYVEKYDGRIIIEVLVSGINLSVFDKNFKLSIEE